MLVAIIMAGGSGERFWPLSTPKKPKQLLSIFSNKTMLRETIDRISPIVKNENIFITTNILQEREIKRELEEIPNENIIIEPYFKDTAAAIGYACMIIKERFKDIEESIEIIVLSSDHIIKKEDDFREVILKGAKEARENSTIVTLGIKPSRAETGYGYIEVVSNKDLELNSIYKVKRFREKPNKEIAESYLLAGNYLWNSGMFIFNLKTIIKSFETLMPEHMNIFYKIQKKIEKKKHGKELSDLIKEDFKKFEKISIDFGIMEYSKNIKVLPISIGWNDVGSFLAFDEIFEKDENNNVIVEAEVISEDSENNIIIGKDCKISVLGINNLVIVKNGKDILISSKDRVQDIKKIVVKHKEG